MARKPSNTNELVDQDPVDEMLAQWARARPEYDVSGLAVVGRIVLIAKHFHRLERRALRQFDLDPWAFEVLASLRRQGPPFQLSPTQLRRLAVLTSGAMTNRLDRLEEQRLVKRTTDPADRRGVVITLLPDGVALVDKAMTSRLTEITRLLEPLTESQQDTAAHILRSVLTRLSS